MHKINWIKLTNNLRYLFLILYVLCVLIITFNWYKNFEFLNSVDLNKIGILFIIVYSVLYVIELKLTIKLKNSEIADLKSQLLIYEKK